MSSSCVSGFCNGTNVASCGASKAMCAGACADLQKDDANCGACGHACGAGFTCLNGACGSACAVGLTSCGAACVDTSTDRPTAATAPPRAPAESCRGGACACTAPGEVACGGACVLTGSDPENCGACGNACAAGHDLRRRDLRLPCRHRALRRASATRSRAIPHNCGTCGIACSGGDGFCQTSACVASCTAPFSACGQSCVERVDRSPELRRLRQGVRRRPRSAAPAPARCPAGFIDCGGACVDVDLRRGELRRVRQGLRAGEPLHRGRVRLRRRRDAVRRRLRRHHERPKNCGACGTACAAGEVCALGACAASCPTGLTNCGGAASNLTSDPRRTAAPAARRAAPAEACAMGACSCASGDGVRRRLRRRRRATPRTAAPAATPAAPTSSCAGRRVRLRGGPHLLRRRLRRHRERSRRTAARAATACAAGQVCARGACAASCPAALTNCSGACVDLATDRPTAAPAARRAPPGRPARRAPAPARRAPRSAAGRAPTSPNDPANCGACGNVVRGRQELLGRPLRVPGGRDRLRRDLHLHVDRSGELRRVRQRLRRRPGLQRRRLRVPGGHDEVRRRLRGPRRPASSTAAPAVTPAAPASAAAAGACTCAGGPHRVRRRLRRPQSTRRTAAPAAGPAAAGKLCSRARAPCPPQTTPCAGAVRRLAQRSRQLRRLRQRLRRRRRLRPQATAPAQRARGFQVHTDCGTGACVNPNRDPQNCGACGNACGAGETCRRGRLPVRDGPPRLRRQCVDPLNDPSNCGACGDGLPGQRRRAPAGRARASPGRHGVRRRLRRTRPRHQELRRAAARPAPRARAARPAPASAPAGEVACGGAAPTPAPIPATAAAAGTPAGPVGFVRAARAPAARSTTSAAASASTCSSIRRTAGAAPKLARRAKPARTGRACKRASLERLAPPSGRLPFPRRSSSRGFERRPVPPKGFGRDLQRAEVPQTLRRNGIEPTPGPPESFRRDLERPSQIRKCDLTTRGRLVPIGTC